MDGKVAAWRALGLPKSIPCKHLHLRRFSRYVNIFSSAKKARIVYRSKCSRTVKSRTNLNLSGIIVIILRSLIGVPLTSPVSWVTSSFRLHSPRSHTRRIMLVLKASTSRKKCTTDVNWKKSKDRNVKNDRKWSNHGLKPQAIRKRVKYTRRREGCLELILLK